MEKTNVIIVFVISVLLSSAIFYYANQLTTANSMTYQNIRKEDTYLAQQRIEQSLSALNQTLQAELAYQESLSSKVTELYAKADLPPPVITKTTYVTPSPVITPTPTPVTRAS